MRRLMRGLRDRLSRAMPNNREIDALRRELEELRSDVNELRRDNLRIAQLHDAVVDRLAAERPSAPNPTMKTAGEQS